MVSLRKQLTTSFNVRGWIPYLNKLITLSELPPQIETIQNKSLFDPTNLDSSYDEKIKGFEKAMIAEALEKTGGNKSAAARILKITERHLRSRLERLT